MPGDLVERLQAFAETGTASRLYRQHYVRRDAKKEGVPEDPLMYVPSHAARELDDALTAAGISKHAPGGKVDFHSLRVFYVSLVLECGAGAKEAQALARHATPELTMNVYGRARQDRLSELAEAVGEIVKPGEKYAVCMQRKAAGAERMDVTVSAGNGLALMGSGGGGGNRTRVP